MDQTPTLRLPADVQQLVEQLLRGGDDPGAAAVLGRGEDQVDQVLADVGVGELDGAGGERADAARPGSPIRSVRRS